MDSLRMLGDAALQSRIDHLKVNEQDLAERVGKQRARLEAEDRWNASDPLYQRLFFNLVRIREDLRNSEGEEARRANNRGRRLASTTTERVPRTSYAQRGPILRGLAQRWFHTREHRRPADGP